MRVLNNVIRGVTYVGQVGALIFGFLFVGAAIFGEGSSIFLRSLFVGLAICAFLGGYFAKEPEVA